MRFHVCLAPDYDALGLLRPAHVQMEMGYRFSTSPWWATSITWPGSISCARSTTISHSPAPEPTTPPRSPPLTTPCVRGRWRWVCSIWAPLTYAPDHRATLGADHAIEVLARQGDTVVVHDPADYPAVSLPVNDLLEA